MEINNLQWAEDRSNDYYKIALWPFPLTREIKGVKMKYLIEIVSNAGFLQFYNPSLPSSSHALVNFSGESAAVAMLAVEEWKI